MSDWYDEISIDEDKLEERFKELMNNTVGADLSDGWKDPDKDELQRTFDFIRDFLKVKFGRDYDDCPVIETTFVNRKTHKSLHYRPVPYSSLYHEPTPEESIRLLFRLNTNLAIAQEDLDKHVRMMESNISRGNDTED